MKDLFEGLIYESDCNYCYEPNAYRSQFPDGVGHGRCTRCNQGALRCPTAVGVPGMPGVPGMSGVQVPDPIVGDFREIEMVLHVFDGTNWLPVRNKSVFVLGVGIYDSADPDKDVGWMTEGIYSTESEAIADAKDGEFLIEIELGRHCPAVATDAIKMYWPKHETWETSKLYKLRNPESCVVGSQVEETFVASDGSSHPVRGFRV
jgi:hypothetical protein